MFRETDETVTEPQFVALSYIQAQHDYLQVGGGAGAGQRVAGRGEGTRGGLFSAADMCVPRRREPRQRPIPAPCPLPRLLQGQYPVIREDAAQMCALQMQAEHGPTLADDAAGFESALEKFVVKQILTSRPRQEWLQDVASRYRALSQFSKDDARTQVGWGGQAGRHVEWFTGVMHVAAAWCVAHLH